MSISTDSKTVEDKKNPEECNVFSLYKLVSSDEEIEQMKQNYLN
jgi:tryptophanyl-tRNA synthetase